MSSSIKSVASSSIVSSSIIQNYNRGYSFNIRSSNITFDNLQLIGNSGGIIASEYSTIIGKDSIFRNNVAENGPAINSVTSNFYLDGISVIDNRPRAQSPVGGFYFHLSFANISHSLFSGNTGESIDSTDSDIIISDSNFTRTIFLSSSSGVLRIYGAQVGIVRNSRIFSNNATGVYIWNSKVTVEKCEISDNRLATNGAVVHLRDATTSIYNSIIANNEELTSGAVYSDNSRVIIHNTIIANNNALGGFTGGINHSGSEDSTYVELKSVTISGNYGGCMHISGFANCIQFQF